MDGLKDERYYQRPQMPIPYYNGYNESTVAHVYTHYNEAICYTPSTKST